MPRKIPCTLLHSLHFYCTPVTSPHYPSVAHLAVLRPPPIARFYRAVGSGRGRPQKREYRGPEAQRDAVVVAVAPAGGHHPGGAGQGHHANPRSPTRQNDLRWAALETR